MGGARRRGVHLAFDAPSLLRFSLLLLVPLGSWLGGALVERLVDSALR